MCVCVIACVCVFGWLAGWLVVLCSIDRSYISVLSCCCLLACLLDCLFVCLIACFFVAACLDVRKFGCMML